MNSNEGDLFSEQTGSTTKLEKLHELTVPGRLPSWNDILGMEQWARYKYKNEIQIAFLSALQASAGDCLTRTTSARNSMSIAAATLVSYREMAREKRKLKLLKKKQSQAKESGLL